MFLLYINNEIMEPKTIFFLNFPGKKRVMMFNAMFNNISVTYHGG